MIYTHVIAIVLGVILLGAIVTLFLPDKWYQYRWYFAPSSLFGWIVTVAVIVGLSIPHA